MAKYIILAILYSIVFTITFCLEIVKIGKSKQVKIITFVSIFYILFYFFAPIIIYILKLSGISLYYDKYIENCSNLSFWLTFIFAIIGYVCIYLGQLVFKKIKKKDIVIRNKDEKKLFFAGCLCFVIGFTALMLWTSPYGFLWNIIPYASSIRGGVCKIYNKFTIVKPFCSFCIVSFLCFFSLMFCNFKNETKCLKILIIGFSVLSLFTSVIYMLANDGRMIIIIFLLSIFLYICNKIKFSKKQIFCYSILVIISLVVFLELNNIMRFIRTGELKFSSTNLIKSFANEFMFPFSNNLNVIDYAIRGNFRTTILEDLLCIFLAWVPMRLKSDWVVNLFGKNTSYFYPDFIGQVPTDLISASIFEFHFLGIIVLPFLLGIVMRFISEINIQNKNSFDMLFYFYFGITLSLKVIAYYDISHILYTMFSLIIGYIIINFICYFDFKKFKLKR